MTRIEQFRHDTDSKRTEFQLPDGGWWALPPAAGFTRVIVRELLQQSPPERAVLDLAMQSAEFYMDVWVLASDRLDKYNAVRAERVFPDAGP